jgi:hypothetical protein
MNEDRVVELGDQRFAGLVFIYTAAGSPPPHRLHDTGRADVTHISTDDIKKVAHIRQALIEQIAGARRKVLFCSFLFADDLIVDSLCAAAERLHGGVYVLTALDKHLWAEVTEPDTDADANTLRQRDRAQRHERHLKKLAHAGVWLHSASDCHAKFSVVDDEIAIVTSANATQEAYEINPEDGLVVRNASVAREFSRLFAHIWRYLANLESTPGAQLDVHSLPEAAPSQWQALQKCGGIDPVTTLRGIEASLQRAAIEVIDSAREHLAIASYSFMGMEDHPIGRALHRSLERNVQIDLLIQPRDHIAPQRATCSWLVGLAPERVRLHGHRKTHTKSIVADGRQALLWTGNLEAAHGWSNGIEIGLHIADDGIASAISGWTRDVMNRGTHTAFMAPSARELIASGQRRVLAGEWTLALPPGASADRVLDAISRFPLELVEHFGKLVLTCAETLAMDVQIDEPSRQIVARNVRSPERLPGGRTQGWVCDSQLRIIESKNQRLKR